MTNNTEEESNPGPTVPVTTVSIRTARRKDKEDLLSLMAVTTRDNFTKTRSQASATTTGLMASHTLETGQRTKWTVTACSPGKTERGMKVTL